MGKSVHRPQKNSRQICTGVDKNEHMTSVLIVWRVPTTVNNNNNNNNNNMTSKCTAPRDPSITHHRLRILKLDIFGPSCLGSLVKRLSAEAPSLFRIINLSNESSSAVMRNVLGMLVDSGVGDVPRFNEDLYWEAASWALRDFIWSCAACIGEESILLVEGFEGSGVALDLAGGRLYRQ